jgi:hypothetical protein
MKTRTRRNFVEASKEFGKIRSDAVASYPAAKRQHERLRLLAYLRALGSEFRSALEALRELKLAEPPTPAPPWFTPDWPIAQLRGCRLKLLDRRQTAAGVSSDGEETARERAWLAPEPAPGCELVDACQDMAWFQDIHLIAEIFSAGADATALPAEDSEDFIDEAARAKMAEAKKNKTLGRMKDYIAGGDADSAEINRLTKAVERGRKQIDGWLEDSKEAYQAAAAAGIRVLSEKYPWVFASDQESRGILEHADDRGHPENRLRMKQWLTTQIVLDTAEEWAEAIRSGIFGDGGKSARPR